MAECATEDCTNATDIGMKYCDECTITRHDYWSVYVLKLQDGCFYIGMTTSPEKRIREHVVGERSVDWTDEHKPVDVLEVREEIADVDEEAKALAREREVTLEYMREKGWKRVRGGPWCEPDMDSAPWE